MANANTIAARASMIAFAADWGYAVKSTWLASVDNLVSDIGECPSDGHRLAFVGLPAERSDTWGETNMDWYAVDMTDDPDMSTDREAAMLALWQDNPQGSLGPLAWPVIWIRLA